MYRDSYKSIQSIHMVPDQTVPQFCDKLHALSQTKTIKSNILSNYAGDIEACLVYVVAVDCKPDSTLLQNIVCCTASTCPFKTTLQQTV